MIKSSLVFLFLLLMTISHSHAGLDMEKISLLLETKYTPLDMDSDGTSDVSRTFHSGELVRVHYSYPMTEKGTEEVWQLSSNKTWTEVTILKQRLPISRVIEQYSDQNRDQILKIETYWQSGKDSVLDMKIIDEFVGENIISVKSQLKNGTWQFLSTETVPIELNSAVTQVNKEYAQCLSKSAGNTTTSVACMNQITQAIDKSIQNLASELPLSSKCEDDNFLYFGEGLRVDKKRCFLPLDSNCKSRCTPCTGSSVCEECIEDEKFEKCKRKHALLQIDIRTRLDDSMRAFRDMFKCLNQKNTKMVTKMLKTLIQKRPIIDCVNQNSADGNLAVYPVKGLTTEKIIDLGQSTGGFYWSKQPKRIYLTADSPTVNSDSTSTGETLFHELLHSAGVHDNRHHNSPDNANFAKDAVYGCHMLCATTPSLETKKKKRKIEGCKACLKGTGNAATECTATNGWY